MSKAQLAAAATIGLIGALVTSQARAQSAGADAEIAALKQQLRLMEQKLDKLQRQTAANTAAAATANAKADAKVSVANAAAYPVKSQIAPSDAVVKMPNNRPTICTADDQNCVSIVSRVHFDAGGYDYRPNTAATTPQRLDNGVNVRRARIGVIGKFMDDWNYALIYDFGGTSDAFAGTASAGGVSDFFQAAPCRALRTPISVTPASSRSAANWRSKGASWTCPTRWTRRQARTTCCSWSV